MARHGYDAICAHNLHGLYHIDKFQTDNRTLFDDGKCVNVHKAPMKKCDAVSEYSYEKCE